MLTRANLKNSLVIFRDTTLIFINYFFSFFRKLLPRNSIFFIHVPFSFEIDVVRKAAECINANGSQVYIVASKNNIDEIDAGSLSIVNRKELNIFSIFFASGHIFCDTESFNKDYILKLFAGNISYIPYGISVSAAPYSRVHQYRLPVHRLSKFIFVPSEIIKKRFVSFSNFPSKKIVVASHPKADRVLDFIKSQDKSLIYKDKIRILWNCHYSKEWGNFDIIAKPLLNYIKDKDWLHIFLSPHPFFDISDWSLSEEDLRDWQECLENKKIIIDNETNYCQQLASSDALLTDGSSVIYDYLPTGRPILYISSKRNYKILDEEYKFLKDYHCISNNSEDFSSKLDDLIKRVNENHSVECFDKMSMASPNSFSDAFTKNYFSKNV